ncbi:UNVERIFIED_CONTAM: hypothetical protein Slati_1449900 [Sesamum latifolium]|uniref:Uncharacterized protein n=1 Tax=Sesamum latifolium TaxID=2727402 RepID=A0AAW2X9S5_9LAMI
METNIRGTYMFLSTSKEILDVVSQPYSKKPNHTKETCWKLHGKPPRTRKEGDRKEGHAKAHFADSETYEVQAQFESDIKDLSKEEIEHLRSIMNSLEGSGGSSCSLAQIGKSSIFHALSASFILPSSSWVVDLGDNDHITTSHHSFITYNPCPSNQKVKVAQGSLATVAGQELSFIY